MLILLLLLAGNADAHMVAFPHAVELRFESEHVDVVHSVKLHPRDQTELLGPRMLEDLEVSGRKVADRLAEAGPRLRIGARPAVCEEQGVSASARRTLDVVVRLRCQRPPGRLDVLVQGASPWTTGLLPVTVHASLLSPTLEGQGAPLAGRDAGPWVGAVVGDATLGFVVPADPGKVAPSEEP